MKIARLITTTITAVLLLSQSAGAEFDGSFNLTNSRTESFENGVRRSRTDTFNQNYYLGLTRRLTPVFTYRLFLRSNLADTQSTTNGTRRDTYRRTIEPTLDLFLRNPTYNVNAGYRRTENWDTASLKDESRRTTEFYYARVNVNPWDLPSLTLEADRRKEFDYLSVAELDTTTDRYSAGSYYRYFYQGFETTYNVTFTRTETETPLDTVIKTETDVFGGLFTIGYTKPLFGGKVNASTRYQANYSRNDVTRFISQTGAVVFERTPFQGLYALGVLPSPGDVPTLGTQNAFVDNDTATGVAAVDLATGQFHNVGLQVLSSLQTVDRLFVYVKTDGNITSDANLSNPANWVVAISNTNTAWTQIPVTSVSIVAVDAPNNVYRYELTFAAQTAAFYKAINQATVNVFGVLSALVSEVEALGTDIVPSTGEVDETSKFFTQGWNLNIVSHPAEKVDVTLNYYITQADQNPTSIFDSFEDFIQNIASKTRKSEDNLRRTVSRTYGPGVTWRMHRLLTTDVRVTRSEIFDNLGTTDSSSNNYSLSFSSSPVKNLDATLSYIRNDSFTFGDRETTTDSYLLSVGSKLYREVNMIVDLGYSSSEQHDTDEVTKTSFVRGSIDARITRELFTNFSYGITHTLEPTSATTQEGTAVVAYRLGRMVNITGNFRYSDNDGETTTSEGITIDWLPIRVVRLNLNYQHQREPQAKTTDSISSFVRWNIKRFLDLQLTYTYRRTIQDSETEDQSIVATLNGRF